VVLFDRALTPAELTELMDDGIAKALAVYPAGKLAVTWGDVKARK
jgi:hypothetical protein